MVELAQALQALLRQGADSLVDARFFAIAGAGADTLIDMLDRLAANQQPDSPIDLVTALQEFEFAEPVVAFDIPLLDDVVDAGAESPPLVEDEWTEPALISAEYAFELDGEEPSAPAAADEPAAVELAAVESTCR